MIFSYAWRSKLRNVEAWVAVRLLPGPNLLEHTVKKGEAFRNIVAWIGGALPISFCSDIPLVHNHYPIPVPVLPTHVPPPPLPPQCRINVQFSWPMDPNRTKLDWAPMNLRKI